MKTIDPQKWSLFLDFDGTLIEIERTPREVVVPSDLTRLLAELQQIFGGAVAIVTGRRVCDVDLLLAPLQLVTAGVHGTEFRLEYGGQIEVTESAIPRRLTEAVFTLAGHLEGIIVELKKTALAIHVRRAPYLQRQIGEKLEVLVREYGNHLMLSRGRMVFEILPRAVSKGAALKAIAKLPPFEGRLPIMVGDDAPDVSAMDAASQLGGLGLTVAGEYFSLQDSNFRDPSDVRLWLGHMMDARG